MLQFTAIQIDDYGPWTVKPKHKRESDLQIIQSRLYLDIQTLFSTHGGFVFRAREDSLLALSNGIGEREHYSFMEQISSTYPFTVSMGVSSGETPLEAQKRASEVLYSLGGSRDPCRRGKLKVDSLGNGKIQIAHFDLESSRNLTDSSSIYESFSLMREIEVFLSEELRDRDSLLFYMGGDNFMGVTNFLDRVEFIELVKSFEKEFNLTIKVGEGESEVPLDAVMLSSLALDDVRSNRNLRVSVRS